MTTPPEVGKEYAWQHGGQTARVIVKTPPLPLMTEMKWTTPGEEPGSFPDMAVQCEVEILPWGKLAFACVEDLALPFTLASSQRHALVLRDFDRSPIIPQHRPCQKTFSTGC